MKLKCVYCGSNIGKLILEKYQSKENPKESYIGISPFCGDICKTKIVLSTGFGMTITSFKTKEFSKIP